MNNGAVERDERGMSVSVSVCWCVPSAMVWAVPLYGYRMARNGLSYFLHCCSPHLLSTRKGWGREGGGLCLLALCGKQPVPW
jgi:hypothetical protein